jgi:hypothetical protein
MTSYLFRTPNGDIEVTCTGRYAVKKSLTTKNTYKKIEITPLDDTMKWKKFVDESELLEIKHFECFEKDKLF